jgi:hypothetical protein
MRPWLGCAALALGACLEPQVSDDVARPDLVLPPGTTVPSLYDDPAVSDQIDAHGVPPGTIVLRAAFSAGAPAAYWDLGPTTDVVAPIYFLVDPTASGAPLPVPPVVDKIPGDPGYSPFWVVFNVPVTSKYGGQVFPSLDAITEGVRQGLLQPPKRGRTGVHYAVASTQALLRSPAGGTATIGPTAHFYYRGKHGLFFDFGLVPLADDRVHAIPQNLYRLRREGGEPLSEPERGVDMDGDGDTDDTNDVLAMPGAAPAVEVSSLCRVVSVTVAPTTASIDTTGSQTRSSIMSESDLFSSVAAGLTPIIPTVVAFKVEDQLVACPQRVE